MDDGRGGRTNFVEARGILGLEWLLLDWPDTPQAGQYRMDLEDGKFTRWLSQNVVRSRSPSRRPLFSECDSARPRAVTIEIGFQLRLNPDATGEGVLSITGPATTRSLASGCKNASLRFVRINSSISAPSE